MGARKGQNNFKRAAQVKIADRKKAIEAVFCAQMPKGFKAASFTAFAKFVAEKAGIPVTTLIRAGSPYRETLWQEHAKRNLDLTAITPELATSQQLRDLLRLRDVALSNRNVEVERLKRIVANQQLELEQRAGGLELTAQPSAPALSPPNNVQDNRLQADFESTCHALRALLEHLAEADLGVMLNEKSGDIVDTGGGGVTVEVIVKGKDLQPYLRWLRGRK